MMLGRVSGNVQATIKNSYYEGLSLFLVEPIDLDGKRKGRDLITVDRVGAGIGDIVLLNQEGGGAAESIGRGKRKPVDTVIIAIVDEINRGDS